MFQLQYFLHIFFLFHTILKLIFTKVECHPHYRQDELINYCTKEGIHVQAYSSLGSSGKTALLKDPVVNKIAKELNVSPARVLLKWAVQQGIGIYFFIKLV